MTAIKEAAPLSTPQRGLLAFVERVGNLLPEPAMIFVWLILALALLSVLGSWLGWSAAMPFRGEKPPEGATLAQGVITYSATSLLSEENVRRLLNEMPRTMSNFAPLGIVLVTMLGAAVAEGAGLFSALIRASLRNVPRLVLTPTVALIGMFSHHADAAAYLIFIPLAALAYAAVGRHPLAGLAAAFAAVSGGYAGNFTPGQMDITLFSFTQEAARIIDPDWQMNPVGNWWFVLSVAVLFTPVIWFITDRVVEPRLGRWRGAVDAKLEAELAQTVLLPQERKGLRRAGLAFLAVVGLFCALVFVPGYTPLIDSDVAGTERFQPLFGAFVAGFFLLFLFAGIAFGSATGTVKSSRDVIQMMQAGVRSLAPYVVFVFFAAHFVAMFNWSRIGPIIAINGAEALAHLALPAPLLLVGVQMLGSFLDLFIGSASAKWSAMAPVVVPMFMLLGISPEMTTAAYRMGDSYTNIMTPLMSYFPLLLVFARRWDSQFGVGSLLALMLPYALAFMAIGLCLVIGWATFDLPLGPGAQVYLENADGVMR